MKRHCLYVICSHMLLRMYFICTQALEACLFVALRS